MKKSSYFRKVISLLALSAAVLSASALETVRIPAAVFAENQGETSSGLNPGYYNEFLGDIAEKGGWTYDHVSVDSRGDYFNLLEKDKVDLIYGAYRTEEKINQGFIYSKYPCGTVNMVLIARQNDDRFNMVDFSKLNGCTVGFEADNPFARKYLARLEQEYNIRFKALYFEKAYNAVEQLNLGSIDLCLVSLSNTLESSKIIYNCGQVSVYFVSRNPEIISVINSFLGEVAVKDPFFFNNLFLKSNSYASVDVDNVTEEERAFVLSEPSVRFVAGGSIKDDDLPRVRKNFWAKTENISGLKIRIDESENLEPEGNEITVFEFLSEPQDWDTDIVVTHPVYNMNVRLLCSPKITLNTLSMNSRFVPDGFKIAVTPDLMKVMPYFANRYNLIRRENIVVLKDPMTAIEGTSKGKYSACLVNDFYLMQKYSISDFPALETSENALYTVPMSIGVKGKNADAVAKTVSVLNKTFARLPYNYYNSLQNTQGLQVRYEAPWKNIVTRHFIIGTAILFILVVYTLLIVVFRSKGYLLQSKTDYVTGLWNMKGFEDYSVRIMEDSRKVYAVTEFHIRGFAGITKLHGAELGDRLIQIMSEELNREYNDSSLSLDEIRNYINARTRLFFKRARYEMNIAHSNGGSFYVIQEMNCSKDEFMNHIKNFQNELQEKLCRTMQFSVVVKSGTAFSNDAEKVSVEEVRCLLDNAEYACGSKSDSMLDNVGVFDDKLKVNRESEEKIDAIIESALAKEEFYVVYQPKTDVKTGKIKGAEALVRWNHGGNEELFPDRFIRVLEKNGYIEKLDFYVYRKTFDYMTSLMEKGIPLVPISLNVSRQCFDALEFAERFYQLFSSYNISPSYIELEIEERFCNAENRDILAMAEKFKSYGFTVSMDDFGSGESSLNMLSEIPVDVIKIDKGFLDKSETSDNSRIVLDSMVGMAKKMGKTVVCEGVENAGQVQLLKDMGCDLIQGYYYSRPLEKQDFTDYLVKHQ